MDKSKQALERVRPILQAMEQSIDAARRRRTAGDEDEDGQDPRPESPRDGLGRDDARSPDAPIGEPHRGGAVDPETASRMRARPKRATILPDAADREPMRGWRRD